MKLARSIAAMLLAGSAALAFNAPAMSAPLTTDSGLRSPLAAEGVQNVQWRHRDWDRGRHWRGGGYGYRGYGWGPALGGLAAGAMIGGAIAGSQAQARSSDQVAYCSQRFRSYDPASGTYLGHDGLRHPCP
jgi:hypothetical protein